MWAASTRDPHGRIKVFDHRGRRVGRLYGVLPDGHGGAWGIVVAGRIRTQRLCVVPLRGSQLNGWRLTVSHTRATILGAPHAPIDDALDGTTHERLARHYGEPLTTSPPRGRSASGGLGTGHAGSDAGA